MHRSRFVTTVFLSALVIAACGGSGDEPADGAVVSGTQTATEVSRAASPEELGDEVAQHYFDALDRLSTIIDPLAASPEDPPSSELQQEVRDLKDEYIVVFVQYGYEREAMTDAERAAFDSAVNGAILPATPEALDKIGSATTALNDVGETEVADEILSFNILTQYVFFDLLKAQEPEEAERLGIP